MRQPVYHLRGAAEYCHQLDAELIDGMRTRAAVREHRLRLAEAAHVSDSAILDALEKLGFDHTTVPLLFVMPLLQVAWANGAVSQPEREHIAAVAELRGVTPATPAYKRLTSWLDRRPPDEFFEGALGVIEAVLSTLPPDGRSACKNALLRCCWDTAAAPLPLLGGLSRVHATERKVIENIGRRLEPEQQDRSKNAAAGRPDG